jgi:glutamyl-tRNA synthetase
VAWLFARSAGSRFLVRIEDLDQIACRPEFEQSHLADLASLGLDWDGEVVRQSERTHLYDAAIARLDTAGLTYPCYCTRREVLEAAQAPHGHEPEGAYPGTCRHLTPDERAEREAGGRTPALRLRAEGTTVSFVDRLVGAYEGTVDDFVIRRRDGAPAYNLAVVVDDAGQGIEEVVRGDDLVPTTPRQIHLARLLGLPVPSYAHVALVLGPDGERLAKRHGAVTLADRHERGEASSQVLSLLAASLGLASQGESISTAMLVDRFDPGKIPRDPWVLAQP